MVVNSVFYFAGEGDGVFELRDFHGNEIGSLRLSDEVLDSLLLIDSELGDFDRKDGVVSVEELTEDQHVRVREETPKLSVVL